MRPCRCCSRETKQLSNPRCDSANGQNLARKAAKISPVRSADSLFRVTETSLQRVSYYRTGERKEGVSRRRGIVTSLKVPKSETPSSPVFQIPACVFWIFCGGFSGWERENDRARWILIGPTCVSLDTHTHTHTHILLCCESISGDCLERSER